MVEQLREQLKAKEAALDDLVQDSLGDLKAFRDVVEERNGLRVEVEGLQSKMTQFEAIMGDHVKKPGNTNSPVLTAVTTGCPNCSAASTGVTALHWVIAIVGVAVAAVQLIYLTTHC